ncbi:MAG: geranylgeranyl diphosphate reductase [Pseudomonadota bacterium]
MSSEVQTNTVYDAIVVGGGPAGATAAQALAEQNHTVLLINKPGRIKPCGGAIPPRLVRDFDIPESQIVAHANTARMVSPKGRIVDMPINGGSVAMVDREHFDEWLRQRAAQSGAERLDGEYVGLERDADGSAIVLCRPAGADRKSSPLRLATKTLIGADGARSRIAAEEVGGAQPKSVFAYHEIVRSPEAPDPEVFAGSRCEIRYEGRLSPDFYAWIFPHGDTTSVGVGSAQKGFSLRHAVSSLRDEADLATAETVRTEGAPIPLKPMKKWDNGKDVMLAGDAAGCVAPASGEGIYYAMLGGQVAAEGVHELLVTGDAKALARARKRYMSEHGKVFFILGIMQHFWYRNDKRRERFVNMCDDPDVQRLTWEAYMNKRLVRADPMAHLRIFIKDMAHLLGFARVEDQRQG